LRGVHDRNVIAGAFVGCISCLLWPTDILEMAITVCVVIFDIGAIIQTAAPNYEAW